MTLSLNPPREPLEVPPHLLALLHRLAQYVAAARVDVEFYGFAQGLQRAIELPRVADRDARIDFAMLYQQRRRHLLRMRQRRMRRVRRGVLPGQLEVIDHELAALGQVVLIGKVAQTRARRGGLEAAGLRDDPVRHVAAV